MPTPSSSALRGESMRTSRPPTRIWPASGWVMPERTLISVDLPAPFSPSRQCTSPGRIARSMWSFARTPGNAFVMPISSTAGSVCPRRRAGFVPCRMSQGPIGYFISAVTDFLSGVSGTLIEPEMIFLRVCWMSFQVGPLMYFVCSSDTPLFRPSV